MDWRELLGEIISNVAERDRIANDIGVHPVTLTRWVSGESSPRPHNLRQLLRALPKSQRLQLLPLLEKIAPEVTDFEIDISAQEIPYKFIMEVLEARAGTSDLLRYWSMSNLILQQVLKQLDPERAGMAITIVRCMPPRDGRVRSLRESLGVGTPPWPGDLEEKALLLGAESLAGHVTVSCRMEQIGDLFTNRTFVPAYQTEHEVSAVACPIMYGGRVAGCLLISSTQKDYFASEIRLSLVRAYANLLALAFNPNEFYDPALLALHVIPGVSVQQKYFSGFRQRVLQLTQEALRANTRLTPPEVEQLVWQEIEGALLELPPTADP